MSLFFDDQAWVTLAEDEARAIVLRLNAKMVSGEGEASRVFVHGPGDPAPSGKHAALPVTAVSRRRLSFYPAGWFVYRLTCAIDAIPRLSAYQHLAFAFAVCGPAATDDTCTPIN